MSQICWPNFGYCSPHLGHWYGSKCYLQFLTNSQLPIVVKCVVLMWQFCLPLRCTQCWAYEWFHFVYHGELHCALVSEVFTLITNQWLISDLTSLLEECLWRGLVFFLSWSSNSFLTLFVTEFLRFCYFLQSLWSLVIFAVFVIIPWSHLVTCLHLSCNWNCLLFGFFAQEPLH